VLIEPLRKTIKIWTTTDGPGEPMMKIKTASLLPLLITGCTAQFAGGPPPPVYQPAPPPPEATRPLNRQEVEGIAINYAASRGYQCRVKEIEREGYQWQVQLAVAPPIKGEIEMKIDGLSGEIVKAHEEIKHREHHRHREHDGDEDED